MPSGPTPGFPSRRPLVLVVEDEFLLALDLELVLERHGYRVLGPDEHALLATAARGATFGALCDIAASRWLGNEAVPRLYALLRGWVDAGLIGSLSLAGEGDDSAAEPAPDGSE